MAALLCGSALGANAQLMDNHKHFTRADTLRGTLSPERSCYDVSFYHLDIKIDPSTKSIEGYNDIRFKTVKEFKRMQVDLFQNMKVDKIVWNNHELKYTREFGAVFIDFPEKVAAGTTQTLRFYYSGNPIVAKRAPWDGGFVWTKDKAGDTWAGVACQGTGASLWWPNKDHQSDEPDSMMISIAVPSDLMNVSNGRLRSVVDQKNGFTQYNWFVSNPINNYDVTVNIGKFEHFSDKHNSLDLDYYVLRENVDKAKQQFKQVKPMLTCFENRFGPYPFYEDGYKLIETPYLGMEHQSAVAYGNKYKNGYLGNDLTGTGVGNKFDFIIIHESGHEWFGNSVTSKDIADMWIHEGFTNYSEALFVECEYGYADYLTYENGYKNKVANDKPIIGPYGVNEEGSGDMYYKGGLMLHTLRSILGDETFFVIVKGIQTKFKHQTVTTDDIINYFNKRSGKDLTKIFYQYLKYTNIPKLELKEENGKVLYRWKADVPGFDMPVKVSYEANKWKVINPTPEWQQLPDGGLSKIKVAEDLFYIDVKKL
ncbi:M1 family metallopeptidase [Solitalea sp. MAHUQ-68]|uniref:M1 family metallopeptidase n=1 Tax=Solitalea agri TaxID=2953739 RepID=A0A9X2F222_9SPHI|nr:M1 family metallopeptidase [Solitalea agri]MCO4292755.1 M1 family metallopeptidase [Solitalea agri]